MKKIFTQLWWSINDFFQIFNWVKVARHVNTCKLSTWETKIFFDRFLIAIWLFTWQPCGHLDFYPYNGKEQPGCILSQESSALIPLTLIKDGIEEASRVLLACNHVRAIKLFTDSINNQKCKNIFWLPARSRFASAIIDLSLNSRDLAWPRSGFKDS